MVSYHILHGYGGIVGEEHLNYMEMTIPASIMQRCLSLTPCGLRIDHRPALSQQVLYEW